MKNKVILFGALLLVTGATFAQQSLLNPVGESLESAAKNQLEDAAKQKVQQAVPSGVQQNIQTLEADKEKVQQLKSKVDAAPKTPDAAVKVVKGKVKRKAAEKALGSLQ